MRFSMKKVFLAFLISVLFIPEEKLFSQAVLFQDTTMFYKEFRSAGNYSNGVKTGKWVDLSPNGTIYTESWYDSTGRPVGTWKFNNPDGSLRRVTEYSDSGILKWTLYRNKMKLAEVSAETSIPEETVLHLNSFENTLFENEKAVLTSQHVVNNGVVYQGTTTYRIDPFLAVVEIATVLISAKFNGALLIFNDDRTVRRKYSYLHGSEYRISFFYNGRKEITKQDEYRENKIVRTVTFKKNGEQKVKVY